MLKVPIKAPERCQSHLSILSFYNFCFFYITKSFYRRKLELLENNIEKEPQKPRSKLKKKVYFLNIYREHLLSTTCIAVFLQTCINVVEQLKFSHFEGSIIP